GESYRNVSARSVNKSTSRRSDGGGCRPSARGPESARFCPCGHRLAAAHWTVARHCCDTRRARMLDDIWAATRALLGVGVDELTAWQMAIRAFIVYVAAILLVKLGQKRFMGKSTAFDMLLGIMLGSVLS